MSSAKSLTVLDRSFSCLLVILAACSGSEATGGQPERRGPDTIQFAFYHLHDDHVKLSIDDRIVFDRDVTVAPDNEQLGLAVVAQVEYPRCADVVVETRKARAAKRICRTPQTRSIVVDGGPPLTIVAKDRFQGED